MKIYTKTGDDGTTGLLVGGRFGKDSTRIDAYGTVDELNAAIGVTRASGLDDKFDQILAAIQNDLFVVGSALADPNPQGKFHAAVSAEHVTRLERTIDALEEELPPLAQFILPGGSRGAAFVHLARAICRRAERLVVRLGHQTGEAVPRELVIYLNRLSDLLFVLARAVNHSVGVADIAWKGI